MRGDGGSWDADVIVVGAGAAGLWAAAVAAAGGARVLVVEKTSRAGTKVLASGGTRCNLTTTLSSRDALPLYGPAARFLAPALKALPPSAVVEHFHALGVTTVTEPALEKVFPASQRAIDVRDALLRRARAAGAALRFSAPVRGIAPASGGWRVDVGETLTTLALLLCPGGQSYPRMGTTGDGYRWLTDLGLPIVPPVPALVPLTSPAAWVHDLSGVSLQETEARLLDPDGRILARRRRPVLFTHTGLSGPGAMDLSAIVARARVAGWRPGWRVALDLLPHRTLDDVRACLLDAAGARGAPHLERTLGGSVPSRLLAAATAQAGIDDPNPALHRVDRKRRNLLADALKGLEVPISGTLGFDKAEVTAGGLSLDAVDRKTMAVRGHPGLYAFGEILDLTGPIGGLNFQAAFATAELAATAALRGLSQAAEHEG